MSNGSIDLLSKLTHVESAPLSSRAVIRCSCFSEILLSAYFETDVLPSNVENLSNFVDAFLTRFKVQMITSDYLCAKHFARPVNAWQVAS